MCLAFSLNTFWQSFKFLLLRNACPKLGLKYNNHLAHTSTKICTGLGSNSSSQMGWLESYESLDG